MFNFPRGKLIVLVCLGCATACAATISGVVSDDNGQPVADAQVTLAPSPIGTDPSARAVVLTVKPVQVSTSTNGAYEFASIAPGRYVLCAAPSDRSHVNSCVSGTGVAHVAVSEDTDVLQSDLETPVGTPVLVTLVSKSGTGALPTHAFLTGAGKFYPMVSIGQSGLFWAVVPPMTDWRLVTSSPSGVMSVPVEAIHAGAVGVPVSLTASR
jgi:hypothetical protein